MQPAPNKTASGDFFQSSRPTYLDYYQALTSDLNQLMLKHEQQTLTRESLIHFFSKYQNAHSAFETPGAILFILASYECGKFYFLLGEYALAYQLFSACKTAFADLDFDSSEELKKIDDQFNHHSLGVFRSFKAAYANHFLAFNEEYKASPEEISATLIKTGFINAINGKIQFIEQLTYATMKPVVS